MKSILLNDRWVYRNMNKIQPKDIGLNRYSNINSFYFKVIDEELFFLSVIKYGIQFEEVKF